MDCDRYSWCLSLGSYEGRVNRGGANAELESFLPWLAQMAWEEPIARSGLGVETGLAPLQSRNLQSQREANLVGLHWVQSEGFQGQLKATSRSAASWTASFAVV